MKPWTIIQLLESNNSRLFKEQTVKENIDNEEFKDGLVRALSPFITFGIHKVPTKTTDNESTVDWDEFCSLMDDLQQRNLTGHAARDAVHDIMDRCSQVQWNDWYRRILIKDLRCGVSEKTVNKAQKNTVPVFQCMLSHDGTKYENKMKGTCFVENKYDGVRVLAVIKNGTATLHTRNGKILTNFPHVEKALSLPELEGVVLDGEIMSENFQSLMKQVQRKKDAQTQDAYFAVFDMIPLDNFYQGEWQESAYNRRIQLEELYLSCSFDESTIRLVRAVLVDLDQEIGREVYKKLNDEAIENGYEGLMVKPSHMPYVCKRSHAWLKVKPFIEVSLTVVGFEEGTGRNSGRLGALVCQGVDDGKEIIVNVGSGFSDAQRTEIWNNAELVIGQVVEVRADAITQNQDGTYSLRFPRFKIFRGFEVSEKI